ncbi:MAG TPA: TlpA disulfide reductase family protein, partial [Cytophagaceae bacterium]
MKHLMWLMILFIPVLLFAQEDGQLKIKDEGFNKHDIKPLKIGDKVPDIEFTLINYPKSTAHLSDFKGKLVILDFWATWCKPCVKQFPKLDSLQKRFSQEVQILLVNAKGTRDTYEKLTYFYENYKAKVENFALPSAVADTIASAYFVFSEIPHYVWIDGDRIVRAITSSGEVNADNIKRMLTGDGIKLSSKKELDYDEPIYLDKDVSIDALTHYSIFLKGWQKLPKLTKLHKSDNVVRGLTMSNATLLNLYTTAARNLVDGSSINSKRIFINTENDTALLYNNERSKIKATEWNKENLYTYELIVPVAQAGNLYKYMLDDLNRYSGFDGRIENRKIKCFVLVRTGKSEKLISSGGQRENKLYKKGERFLKNAPISDLVNFLDRPDITNFPVVDETLIANPVDIQLPEWNTFPELLKRLQAYGLDLKVEEREITVLV